MLTTAETGANRPLATSRRKVRVAPPRLTCGAVKVGWRGLARFRETAGPATCVQVGEAGPVLGPVLAEASRVTSEPSGTVWSAPALANAGPLWLRNTPA